MLHIAFLNVGQGDTIVVCNPQTSEAIVVDCLNPLAVLDFLQCERVQHVRAVIVTHLHTDHYDGLVRFLEDCQFRGIEWDAVYFHWINQAKQRKYLLDDNDGHSQAQENDPLLRQKKKMSTWRALNSWVRAPANRERVKSPVLLDEVSFQGMTLERLHPVYADIGHLESFGLNNMSVVLRVSSGRASALLTGDLEAEGWDVLVKNTPDLSSDVLKFPHHGAWKRGDVSTVLDRVRPEIVVISVGTIGYQYDHPNAQVFDALRRYGRVSVLCTQATRKCTPEPAKVQDKVNALLRGVQSQFNGLAAGEGCPCASSVVIELGDRARVIHPPQELHRRIIKECCPSAQCRRSARSA
jgi:competence protein ComEC